MSDDVIGWETLKTIDFRRRLDRSLADQESIEESIQEIKIHLETMEDGFGKKMITKSLDTIMDLMSGFRVQIIWINALREGLMEVERRLDRLSDND